MRHIVFAVLLPLICLAQEKNVRSVDVYWREYNGVIPTDAVPGGYDIDNRVIYIGQGYVEGRGIIPGTIYPGEGSITVPSVAGIAKVNAEIKILCSTHKDAFQWIHATSENYHQIMDNKNPVRGGFEYTYALNVGRMPYNGELIVGKIVTASPDFPGQARMYFVKNNEEIESFDYEALIYAPESNAVESEDVVA